MKQRRKYRDAITDASAGISIEPPKRNHQYEFDEQCAFIRWAQFQYFRHEKADRRHERLCLFDCLVVSVNGAILSGNTAQRARQWRKLQKSGARAGVADISILYRTATHGFAVIEMKRRRDQFKTDQAARAAVSGGQDAFLRTMRSVGGYVAVAYGWIHAAEHVCEFMGWDKRERL
jgi:hypothetical protein